MDSAAGPPVFELARSWVQPNVNFVNMNPQKATTIVVAPLAQERPGQVIGRYKLLEELGEGGCGVVFLAEQEAPVKRRVALKVIKPGMESKQVLGRFESERQALALMDHPHIAKVLDAGATDQGRPYFVMELVHGVKITAYCDQHRLSTPDRLELFVQACRAVQHAHQKGIIHRDIKPSNILVAVQDGKPVAKVIDFGIAKATAGQTLTDKTVYTAFEQFLGTPTYMSPEQAEMSPLDIDTRSDIYSLGVLLYELLTGKTPFDPQRLVEAGVEGIRRIIREEEPPPPSTRLSRLAVDEQTTTAKRRQAEVPQLIHQVRGDLDWIVMKALEKDRTRRYETANDLAMDIQRHLRDEPVEAHAPSRVYRLGKIVRRHKLTFAVTGIVFAALATGLSFSLWSLHKANHETARSRQVAQFLQEMLKGVGPSVALGRDTAMLRDILDRTAERLDKELKSQPDIEADLRSTIGVVYFDIGQYTNAEGMFREAVELRRKALGGEQPAVATALNSLVATLWQQGKLAEAETLGREVVAMRRKCLGCQHADVASSLNNLAGVLADQGKLAEAETLHREALAMQRHLLGSEHPFVGLSLYNLARVLYAQRNWGEAELVGREALTLQKKVRGPLHPDVARSANLLANLLREQGKFAEAEALHRETLAMQEKLLGSEHPDITSSLYNLGILLMAQDKFGEAETRFRQALAMQQKLLGREHPSVAGSLVNLGITLQELGKFSEAESLQREALSLRRKLLGNEHPDVAQSLYDLARVLRDEGKLTEAETQHREALAIRRKLPEGKGAATAESIADLARTLLLQKRFLEAETLSRECLALREKQLPDDWETFEARSLLGRGFAGQGKPAEAEPLLLAGYKGMKDRAEKIPAWEKRRLKDALKGLVEFYDSTGKADEAAKWKRDLSPGGV